MIYNYSVECTYGSTCALKIKSVTTNFFSSNLLLFFISFFQFGFFKKKKKNEKCVAGSLSLRSNLLCLKCFQYFEELTSCESKIIQLKDDLWTVYKETCKKHGEKAENHIKGISTQTDLYLCGCECLSKKNKSSFLNLKSEDWEEGKESNVSGFENGKFYIFNTPK